MSSLPVKKEKMPDGTGVLFFIQIFATLGFAVLYSALATYAAEMLHFPAKNTTALVAAFCAFNYGLHMFGGYLGGLFLSNRNLFVGGMILQAIGCGVTALCTPAALYWGLALFLTGSGLNVTCINMMLTQRFKPDDERREKAFLWNYAGMNIGFFVGFLVAGHYQLTKDYATLFTFATVGNIISIVLAAIFWKTLADRDTPLEKVSPETFRTRLAAGVGILVGLVPIVWFLLRNPGPMNLLVKSISAVIVVWFVWLTMRHPDAREKKNMWAYFILTVGSLVFWTLYQMTPGSMQLFAVNNVNRKIAGAFEIAPAWLQNMNTAVIVIGGPLMATLFTRLRNRGWKIDIPKQFAASLMIMGLGFLSLKLGILLADASGMMAVSWFLLFYLCQSVGELLISPIGYAMIGKLAPARYQGIMMGTWMLVTGIASLFAGDLASTLPDPGTGTAIATNPAYASLFSKLGWATILVGVVLAFLVPFLNKLITDKAETPEPTLEENSLHV